ncbi:AMP-dependent synthetase/ligase [Thermodesulfobacteriota bacterium]
MDTVSKLFLDRTKNCPDDVIYTYKREGIWVDITWKQYAAKVREVSNALTALGFKKGDRAVCLSDNRWEWYYYAMGVVMAGGSIAGIYPSNPPQQCRYIIQHSEARFILLEDQEQVDKILEILHDTPNLEKAFVMEKYQPQEHPRFMPLEHLHDIGKDYTLKNPVHYEKRALDAKPEETIALVYTSGTTGPPKAAMIAHKHVLDLAELSFKYSTSSPSDRCLEFLPLAHIAGQVVGHYFRLYTRSPAFIAEGWYEATYNAWEVEPTTFVSTPRMYEKFYNNIQSQVDDATLFQQWIFRLAISVGSRFINLKQDNRPIRFMLRVAYALADFAVFRKFRDILGGKVKYFISGGAPLSSKVVEFFHIIGAPILEAFGMTETTAWVSLNRFEEYKIGSVGKPIEGIEFKIADDGEILIKSPGNCYGYFKDDQSSEQLFDKKGWLRTGDVGKIDEDGFLFITDRMKDIFITAGGKNVAPGNIENLLKTSKYISQAMVYGDKKKYLVGLFTLDEDEISKYARDNRIIFKDTKELTQHPEIYNLIKKEVVEKNKELSSVETIKDFILLREELDEDRAEVTATQKVKRKTLTEMYKDQLEALYR